MFRCFEVARHYLLVLDADTFEVLELGLAPEAPNLASLGEPEMTRLKDLPAKKN